MGGEGFADTGNLVTGLLQLLPGLIDLFQRSIGGGDLGFQIFQGLLGFFNLPLQGIVFILPEGPGWLLSKAAVSGKAVLCLRDQVSGGAAHP